MLRLCNCVFLGTDVVGPPKIIKELQRLLHEEHARACKSFELKYNPDKHWSSVLYQNLNLIEYTDGSNICNINHDDASGFCLDTLTTHCKHSTPVVSGHDTLTTYTDYVNCYPSILQTTSYNFTGTKTTSEVCVGVVKAA